MNTGLLLDDKLPGAKSQEVFMENLIILQTEHLKTIETKYFVVLFNGIFSFAITNMHHFMNYVSPCVMQEFYIAA